MDGIGIKKGKGMLITSDSLLSINVQDYSLQLLNKSKTSLQLKRGENTYLFVDMKKIVVGGDKCPNRFNSLYGAGVAAAKAGLTDKAVFYYKQLSAIANASSNRPELLVVREFLNKHS